MSAPACLLVSKGFLSACGPQLDAAAGRVGVRPETLQLPEGTLRARLSAADCERVDAAFLTRDWRYSVDDYYPKFCDAMMAATRLKWVHFVSTGIDQHPFVPKLIERGVKLTTSAGTNGEPVGQTAIAGLLMLARRFPRWLAAQDRRVWEPMLGTEVPPDLRGQTVVIVGVGTIGMTVARFCKALGMTVIGIRRSPRKPDDTPDEVYPPARFAEVLPRCQWVVLACPLTPETRQMVNASSIARLPRGAGIVNVARGGVVDEPALIEALRSGQLGCAYLDVFAKEPLPAESPLWDMPNVIVTPHSAGASSGNDGRAAELFVTNFELWGRGAPLINEFTP